MISILEIENLQLRIGTSPNEHQILNDVSFQLKKNEILGLVGASGSGKSMTLRSIIRLFEQWPYCTQYGMILYTDNNGKKLDIVSASDKDLMEYRRSQVGIIFQQSAQVLNPSIRVGDQIKERLDLISRNKTVNNRSAIIDLMEEVYLTPASQIYERYPHELSGGQLQRILIAMALANNPQLLLADEPTFNLDKETEKDIIDLLLSIKKKRSLSILFISHDMDLVNKFCDRVITINNGIVYHSTMDVQAKYGLKDKHIGDRSRKTIVELKNISKSYNKSQSIWDGELSHLVLQDYSLSINYGQIVGLIGPSGCGKSTLAKIISGIDHNYTGEYLLDGKNVKQFRKSELKRMHQDIQIIFQDSYSAMPPHIPIIDLFNHIISTHNLDCNISKLIELLNSVGLEAALLDRLPSQLSGGQRQRLLIAKALIVEPKLLICDEIVSSLDGLNKASVIRLLRELVVSQGVALLFISHDTQVLDSLCDKIYPMNCL